MLAHLADVSIRSLLLALTAAVVLLALRRQRTAAMQHAVWAAVVCGMLALFAFGETLPRFSLRILNSPAARKTGTLLPVPASIDQALTATTSAGTGYGVPVFRPTQTSPSIDWSSALLYAYAAIAFAFLARFVTGMFLIRRLLAKSAAVRDFRESALIAVPLTVGWLRPKILLPLEWREWDPDKLNAVLAHERAHVRRRDGLIAALAGINRCIFWFHPLAWMLERKLALLAELACDESCVATLGDRDSYARVLLEMACAVDGAHGRLRQHALTMAASSHIRQRIDSLLREGRTFSRGLTWTGWAAVALFGIPVLLGAAAVTLDRQPPALQLEIPRLSVPTPPVLLAQAQLSPPAPAPAPLPQFEVASIRPAGTDANSGRRCFDAGFTMDAGRVDIKCASLQQLMEYAFRIHQMRVTGPVWLSHHGGPKFDIAAKLPQGASQDQVPEMLQSLLAERFKLAIHREYKEPSVDSLVVAKGGLKVEPAPPEAKAPALASTVDPDAPPPPPSLIGTVNGIPTRPTTLPDGARAQTNPRIGIYRETTVPRVSFRWELPNTTFQGLADLMAERLKRPVVDMTGLTGRYQVVLEVATAPENLFANVFALPDNATLADVDAAIADMLTGLRDNFKPALEKLARISHSADRSPISGRG
jgi:uncharacterized protein (TIGR03435 family)